MCGERINGALRGRGRAGLPTFIKAPALLAIHHKRTHLDQHWDSTLDISGSIRQREVRLVLLLKASMRNLLSPHKMVILPPTNQTLLLHHDDDQYKEG